MKSDYLINKEGSDFEVEQLEALLAEFRIDPVPPSMSRIANDERRSIFIRYRLKLVLGLSSLLFTILAAVSIVSLRAGNVPAVAEVNVPEGKLVVETQPGDAVAIPETAGKQRAKQNHQERPLKQPLARRVSSQIASKRVTRSADEISPAERRAYEQVKVALFIAGSKLKIVQDTIDRVNESEIPKSQVKR